MKLGQNDMCVFLEPVTLDNLKSLTYERFNALESLRTPHPLTAAHQEKFFNSLPNRSDIQYFDICGSNSMNDKVDVYGACGLVNVQHENDLAEIALIVKDECRGLGIATKAVLMLLEHAKNINLRNIYGEVYKCSESFEFWTNLIVNHLTDYFVQKIDLPSRKKWRGEYYNSLYFNIDLMRNE